MDKQLQEKIDLSNDLIDVYLEGKIWDKVKKVWRDHKGKIIGTAAVLGTAGAAYANRDKISSGIDKAKEKYSNYKSKKKDSKTLDKIAKAEELKRQRAAAKVEEDARKKANEKIDSFKNKKEQPISKANTLQAANDHEKKKIDQKHKDYNRSQTKEELAKTGITKLGGMIDKRKQPTKMDLERQAKEKKKTNLKRFQNKQAVISKIKKFEKSQKEIRQQRKLEQGRLKKRQEVAARRKKQQDVKDKNKNK